MRKPNLSRPSVQCSQGPASALLNFVSRLSFSRPWLSRIISQCLLPKFVGCSDVVLVPFTQVSSVETCSPLSHVSMVIEQDQLTVEE